MFIKKCYHTGNVGIEKIHYNFIVAFHGPGRINSRNHSIHSHRQRQKVMELLIF